MIKYQIYNYSKANNIASLVIKILPLICGCKGTYLLNNVQY